MYRLYHAARGHVFVLAHVYLSNGILGVSSCCEGMHAYEDNYACMIWDVLKGLDNHLFGDAYTVSVYFNFRTIFMQYYACVWCVYSAALQKVYNV